MDKLDFLDGETPASEPTPAPEAPAHVAEAPEQSSGPVRGPDGKFASASSPEPAPVEVATPAPAPQEAPPPAHVPISALMDERDKRKAMEAQLSALQAQQQRAAPPPPDRYDDPEGYEAFQEARFQQAIYETRRDMSKRFAEMQHTPEVVAIAHEWALNRAASDPEFNAKAFASPDPYGFAVAEMRKEQLLQTVDPGKFDPAQYQQFLTWQAQQAGQGQQQQAFAPVPSQPPQPLPVSLATAPSAGGAAHVPTGPGQAFGRAFG